VDAPLACPSCDRRFGEAERFCPHCGALLVRAEGLEGGGEAHLSARQERARKIKRQYAEGELVRVARAGNLAEAELIQGLLLEEGIPSLLRRSMGFDVPDFVAAGPRDVLVPRSGEAAARDVLLQARPGE
jgi:Putative prokaryotic signal transducing protein